jgi:hypothetical protein
MTRSDLRGRNTTKIAFSPQNRLDGEPKSNVISRAYAANTLLGGSTNLFGRSTNFAHANNRRTMELLQATKTAKCGLACRHLMPGKRMRGAG